MRKGPVVAVYARASKCVDWTILRLNGGASGEDALDWKDAAQGLNQKDLKHVTHKHHESNPPVRCRTSVGHSTYSE